jgi:hypothetical protein
MVGGDNKTIAGVVIGLAAGGVYMTGPLAFPGVPTEIWQGFFWLAVFVLTISVVYFWLVHTVREDGVLTRFREDCAAKDGPRSTQETKNSITPLIKLCDRKTITVSVHRFYGMFPYIILEILLAHLLAVPDHETCV